MKTNFQPLIGKHLQLMGILLVIMTIHTSRAYGCGGLEIYGPHLVCKNTVATFQASPPSFLCGSWTLVHWQIIGDAAFLDPNGVNLGKEIECCGGCYPCQPGGDIRVIAFSNGGYLLGASATCANTGGGGPTQINVKVGISPPASISGVPTEACGGSVFVMTAAPVSGAYSYTYTVPNSSWKVGGVSGPSVTIVGSQVIVNPNIATITVGNSTGTNPIFVMTNMEQCPGDGTIQTPITTYLSEPGTPGKIFYSTNCINEGISITCPAIANASLYFLQVTDGGAPVLTALSPTPDFNFIPTYVASYTVSLIASNVCGSGPAKLSTLNTVDCGGGGTIQRMLINMSPNPANHQVSVDLYPSKDERVTNKISQKDFDDSEMEVVVYSTKDGTLLFSKKTKEKSLIIDTKNMPSDHYVLKANLCDENIVRQLIVNHQ